MAHTFEHTLDEWAKNGTKSAPSSTLKSTGFVGGMKPPASVFNYQWDKIAKAITELQQYALTEDPSGGIWQQLAAVATSGNYNDLLNKPDFKAVATSGSYNDLSDKPDTSGLKMSLAWTNASPNSEFAAQTLSTSFSQYTYIIVAYRVTTDKAYSTLSKTLVFSIGWVTQNWGASGSAIYGKQIFSRASTISNGKITFEGAEYLSSTSSTGNSATRNTHMIPAFILGIK